MNESAEKIGFVECRTAAQEGEFVMQLPYPQCFFQVHKFDSTEHYTPPFHTADYLAQMRRRLYTKNPDHYRQWAALGESTVNWYFVDGEWRHYCNGKRVA